MKGGGYTGRDGHQKVIWQGDLFHINGGICFFELQIICTCSLYFFLDISKNGIDCLLFLWEITISG